MGMKLETGKEMDKRCIWDWLNEVYRHPPVAFNTYSDEQQIKFAYDVLVALKKQEARKPVECEHNGYWDYICPTCGSHDEELFREWNYCPFCGQAVKWE